MAYLLLKLKLLEKQGGYWYFTLCMGKLSIKRNQLSRAFLVPTDIVIMHILLGPSAFEDVLY